MVSQEEEAREREERIFIRVPRKKRTLRFPVYYPTEIVESVPKEEPPKANILDGPLMESSKRRTRNSMKRPLPFTSLQKQPKKPKRKANGRFEVGASSSGTREPPPEWLAQLIRRKNGEDPRKILDKSLSKSDVDSQKYRLSIPCNQIVDVDFLTSEEEKIMYLYCRDILPKGVDATLVASDLREFELNLRLWTMGKTPVYNLVSGWNNVVRTCHLKERDEIHIWSFHANGKLYFAFVPLLATDSSNSISGTRSSALVIKNKPS